eukprot:COSAG05_NODE_668_length_8004_cov_3.894371_10_plen_220_part_00
MVALHNYGPGQTHPLPVPSLFLSLACSCSRDSSTCAGCHCTTFSCTSNDADSAAPVPAPGARGASVCSRGAHLRLYAGDPTDARSYRSSVLGWCRAHLDGGRDGEHTMADGQAGHTPWRRPRRRADRCRSRPRVPASPLLTPCPSASVLALNSVCCPVKVLVFTCIMRGRTTTLLGHLTELSTTPHTRECQPERGLSIALALPIRFCLLLTAACCQRAH